MAKYDIFSNAVDLRDVPESKWEQFIGHGYRSSCYTTDHDRKGVGILFGFDTNGNRQNFILPHKSWVKYVVKYPTKEKDLYGRFVATKEFENTGQRRKWIENATGINVIECMKPENEVLHKLFDNYVLDSDFNSQKMRVFHLDIETEISDQFMKPSDALNRINMITIHDSETDKYYTWSLEHVKIDFKEEPLCNMPKNKFEVFCFGNNEIKLLEHFIDWWQNNYPDVVNSWNGQAYDYPYIVRRIENVLNKGEVQRLSPVGKYLITKVNHDNERANVEAEIQVSISGIFLADELVLYRDKFGVKPSLDGGYSLNNVGEVEGLGNKIHYEGTLKDLYEKDFQRFYEYNVRDVDLLKRIEDKCKLVPLARRIAGSGLCNYDTIYSSIAYLIGSLVSFARTQMGVIFQSNAPRREFQSFEGAFVFPPVPGLYRGGIATIDFNSLYPSSIRAMNISPETYVGKVSIIGAANPDDSIDLSKTTNETRFMLKPANENEKSREISKSQLMELCKTKCIFTRNNTLFLKHSIKQGIVSAWCKHFYALRKSTKKEMQKKEMQIYNKEITDSEEVRKTETEIQNLNNIQLAIKIMINSIYGCLGTKHSPIGDPNLAQTVTRTGKFCNVSASEFIGEWMRRKFKIGENYNVVASGDTDSLTCCSVIIYKE